MESRRPRNLTRLGSRLGGVIITALMLSGCGTDLAGLIQPEIQSAPVENPLASAIHDGDTPQSIADAGIMKHLAETSNALGTQSLPGGITESEVAAFADDLQTIIADLNEMTALACEWQFTYAKAAVFATHCGALAQNIEIDDITIDENDDVSRSVAGALDTVKMDVTLEPEFDLTFATSDIPPETLQLLYVSLAISAEDASSVEPANLFIAAGRITPLHRDKEIDPNNHTWRYNLDKPTRFQDLANRVVDIELTGAKEPMDLLTNGVSPNTVSAAALISIGKKTIRDAYVFPRDITSVDFDITLGDTLTLESGN